MPSIIDPSGFEGGAGTATRGLLSILCEQPLSADCVTMPCPGAHSRAAAVRRMACVGRSAAGATLPAKALYTHSRRFERAVRRRVLDERFDLVVINGSDLLWLLASLPPDLPSILVCHNIEHQLYRTQIDRLRLIEPLRRSLLADWRRLEAYELEGMRRVGNAIFLSAADRSFASVRCPGLRGLRVPPVMTYPTAPRLRQGPEATTDPRLDVGLVANFGWWPNSDGLRWFLTRVLPRLEGNVHLHLFGRGSRRAAGTAKRSVRPRVTGHGFVPRAADIWAAMDFMICPISSGGGVNVKLAEAMYNRVPVLATTFAARGLQLPEGEALVLLDSADEWVDFFNSGRAARLAGAVVAAEVAAVFSADAHRDAVAQFVQDLLRQARAGRRPVADVS